MAFVSTPRSRPIPAPAKTDSPATSIGDLGQQVYHLDYRSCRFSLPGPGREIVEENPMTDARALAGFGHLEGHEPAIIADHRVGGFIARIVIEKCEASHLARPVELQFVKIDVPRAL